MSITMKTKFSEKERALLQAILDALPHVAGVIDRERRFVAVNQKLLQTLGVTEAEAVLQKRPGEAFNCIHSSTHPEGCGCAAACGHCGAFAAINQSQQQGEKVTSECRLSVLQNGLTRSLDLEVTTTPMSSQGAEECTIVSIVDIGDRKRRETLERIFFHDVLNSAGGLLGLLKVSAEAQMPVTEDLLQISASLVEELREHHDLLRAERHELSVRPSQISCASAAADAVARVQGYPAAVAIEIESQGPEDLTLVTDKVLLGRVLTNLVKNAVEASYPGERVTLAWREAQGGVLFEVRNPAVMSDEIRLQVFQRSFSTKEKGRGLGTYSVKLLTERYLGGRVSFRSEPECGTVFEVWYPRQVAG